jgi:hypothetical protein
MKDLMIVKIDAARRALIEAKSLPEVKDIRDKAASIERYLKQKDRSGEASLFAADLKIRAERKLGDLLKETVNHRGAKGVGITMIPTIPVGVSKLQSSRWQRIAELPEEIFERELAEAKADRGLTTQRILRVANRHVVNNHKRKHLEKHGRSSGASFEPGCGIICGDCLEELPKIRAEAGAARLIFADPPYNVGVDYGAGTKADRLPDDEYLRWCKAWMYECQNLLAPDGSLWVLINDEYAAEFVLLLKNLGLYRRAWVKWYENLRGELRQKLQPLLAASALLRERPHAFRLQCEGD